MRFDDYWMDDEPTESKPMAADGRHTGEIIDAKETRLDFMKSDRNRDGACIVVTVAIPHAQPVAAFIPANYRGKVEALARAAGVPLPVAGQEWDVAELIGKTVTVETLQAVSKKGTSYVRIERWFPSPSQPLPAAPRAPARSQAAKAHREFTSHAQGGDEIPF